MLKSFPSAGKIAFPILPIFSMINHVCLCVPFVFPSFCQCVCLSLQAPTASCAVNKRNKEGLSENTTDTSEGRDDVLDRDVVHQSHVSACLLTSCAVISESTRGLVVSHRVDARTFASSLSLCLCVFLSLCLSPSCFSVSCLCVL